MAITPKDNEAFYREVDEELRREQIAGFWQRYGKVTVLAIIALIAAIGGVMWWQHQNELRAGQQGEKLVGAFDAISGGKKAEAQSKLGELAKADSEGYRAAALLTQADLAIEGNDLPRAAALFKQVAEDEGLEKTYRDLALVRMTAVEYDKLAPQVVVDRLKPVAVADNAWFGGAGEMVAIAYMKLNKPQEAARIFAAIAKDDQAPESLRNRARQMAGSLGIDAIDEAAVAKQEGTQ